MSSVIWKLRDDHKNLSRVIGLVRHELEAFNRGATPDFPLIQTILDYMSNFPERCHHPLEDMVYEKLKERDPGAVAVIGDLEREHAELSHRLQRFATAVENVLKDESLPRAWFANVAADYCKGQLHHMQMEEVLFFPPALRALTAADWAEIEARMLSSPDPLFGGRTDKNYKALLKEIMDSSPVFDEDGRVRRAGPSAHPSG